MHVPLSCTYQRRLDTIICTVYCKVISSPYISVCASRGLIVIGSDMIVLPLYMKSYPGLATHVRLLYTKNEYHVIFLQAKDNYAKRNQ